jgi:hypothetical protein
MRQKWFWTAFGFWVFFTSAVITWPLIFCPIRFSPKTLSEFEIKVNGETEHNRVWVNEGRLHDLLPVIQKQWLAEGWSSAGQGIDLTPLLLGQLENSPSLEDQLQIKVFKRKGYYKSLGLLEPSGSGKTYGWEGELPDQAFNTKKSIGHWDFPFLPPPDAEETFCQKLQNFQLALIYLSKAENGEKLFAQLCANQGFSQKLWREDGWKKIYILTKNTKRLLAVLNQEPGEKVLSLVYWKK